VSNGHAQVPTNLQNELEMLASNDHFLFLFLMKKEEKCIFMIPSSYSILDKKSMT